MATDNLSQVGKSLRRTKETADYASKKTFLNKRVERVRDVFDSTVPFEMEFRVDHPSDTVKLDLKFTKPPPRKGCSAGCFSNNCQTFSFTDGGDHLINVGMSYIPETVNVFQNRITLDASHFEETDPANGLILVQGSGADDEVTICFITGDCTPVPFDGTPSGLHQYYGYFVFSSDTYGNNGMLPIPSPELDTTIISSYLGELTFPQFSTWRWAMGLIVSAGDVDTGHQAGIMDSAGYWHIPHNGDVPSAIPPVNILGWSGTQYFTIGVTGYTTANLGGGGHTQKITECMWYFDEVSFENPLPDSGQTVINDVPFPSTGINTYGEFKTYVPYVAGTLHVFVNGVEVAIVETDPNQGLFTFVTPPTPTTSLTITCTYVAQ